jgi:hypothetical protein
MNVKSMNVKVKISTVTYQASTGESLNTLDSVVRMGWVISATPRLIYTQERDSLSVVQGNWWDSG